MIVVPAALLSDLGQVAAVDVTLYTVKIGELRDNWNNLYAEVVGRGLQKTKAYPENIRAAVAAGQEKFRAWLAEYESFTGAVKQAVGKHKKEIEGLIREYNHTLAIVQKFARGKGVAVKTPRIREPKEETIAIGTKKKKPAQPPPVPPPPKNGRPKPKSNFYSFVAFGVIAFLWFRASRSARNGNGNGG